MTTFPRPVNNAQEATTMTTTRTPAPAAHPAAAYHERRRAEVDDRITAAAHGVLDTKGLDGLTIERVAAVSGIAKTTIYRRYENSTQLAVAVVAGRNPGTLETLGEEIVEHVADFLADRMAEGIVYSHPIGTVVRAALAAHEARVAERVADARRESVAA